MTSHFTDAYVYVSRASLCYQIVRLRQNFAADICKPNFFIKYFSPNLLPWVWSSIYISNVLDNGLVPAGQHAIPWTEVDLNVDQHMA